MIALRKGVAGQALLEIAVLIPLLAIFSFGIIDFSRAIYDLEVTRNLAGEGANLASRGTSLPNTVSAVVNDADINMSSGGCVIVSSVTSGAVAGTYVITGQAVSSPCNAATSRVGCYPQSPSCTGRATIPPEVQTVLSTVPNYTVYATEVYFNFSMITPVGQFLHNNNLLPNQLYSVAYY